MNVLNDITEEYKNYYSMMDETPDYGYTLHRGKAVIDKAVLEGGGITFFDIDETLIDSQGKLIKEIYELYKYAYDMGMIVVIITARSGEHHGYTMNQLFMNDITYHFLYLRPPDINNVLEFKMFARKDALESTGLKPVFSVGDMYWDVGPYSGVDLLI